MWSSQYILFKNIQENPICVDFRNVDIKQYGQHLWFKIVFWIFSIMLLLAHVLWFQWYSTRDVYLYQNEKYIYFKNQIFYENSVT